MTTDTARFPLLSLDPTGYAQPAFLRLRIDAEDWEMTNEWPASDPACADGLAFCCEIPPRARAERIAAFTTDEETRRLVATLRAGWTRHELASGPPGLAKQRGNVSLDAYSALVSLRERAAAMTAAREMA